MLVYYFISVSCMSQSIKLNTVIQFECKNSDFFYPRSSRLMEEHIRNPCVAYTITVSIYLMQMRCNLLCTQVCFMIQNLSWNPDEWKKETSDVRDFCRNNKIEFQRTCIAPFCLQPNQTKYIWIHLETQGTLDSCDKTSFYWRLFLSVRANNSSTAQLQILWSHI